MEKYTDAELFFNEFYELFNNNDDSFEGSMEQARLIIQLNTNKFIHLNFVYRISRLFQDMGLIKKSETKIYIEKKIGLKFFKKRTLFIYYKNLDIDNATFELIKRNILKMLSIDFVFEEIANQDLLNELRKLEKLKNIKIDRIIYMLDTKRTYNKNFSDIEILYGVSKNKLLSYIASLNKWNRMEVEQEYKPIYIEENKRNGLIKEFYKNSIALIEQSFKLDKFLKIRITQLSVCRSVPFCNAYLDNMKISNNRFISKSENLDFNFYIDDIAISKSNSTVILRNDNIDIDIKVKKDFSDELEKLYTDYYTLVR